MNKQKKRDSVFYLDFLRERRKLRRDTLHLYLNKGFKPLKYKEEPRHRMITKAWRFRVRSTCYKCMRRKKYVPEQVIAKGEYKPFDHYMCGACENAMRGGRHC